MPLQIRPAADLELTMCARLMSSIDPWVTFERTFEQALKILRDPTREVFVAMEESGLAGFLILCMTGAFIGYIQTVAVAPEHQGRGTGSALIKFAEEKIFAVSPNSFLCVSSFNPDARRLYERLGYTFVGELTDYVVRGHSELLFRKTRGPWSEFRG
jgi:[ribosomal protein S18]-alanine N-acetyltransferase